MMTVSSPKEIPALFADAHNGFPAIIGKPTNNDVNHLRRHNLQALQDIDLRDGTNATGPILSKFNQKAVNTNQVFDRADGALEAYNPSIWDEDNNSVRPLQEKKCSRKLDLQAVIRTAERAEKKFVLSRMEETWVVRLKNETTLFKHVTLRNIRGHLGATITGGESIDVTGLQHRMLPWWVKDPQVPEFIT